MCYCKNVWACALKLPLISSWGEKNLWGVWIMEFAFWGRGVFQKLYFIYWNYYIWILIWENVYLVIVSALCMAWFALVDYECLLVELLCGFVKRNAFQVDSFKALRSSLIRWELIWVELIFLRMWKREYTLEFSLACFKWSGYW